MIIYSPKKKKKKGGIAVATATRKMTAANVLYSKRIMIHIVIACKVCVNVCVHEEFVAVYMHDWLPM